MQKRLPVLLFIFLIVNALQAQITTEPAPGDLPKTYPAQRSTGQFLGNIPPLREALPEEPPIRARGKMLEKKNHFRGNAHDNPNAKPGPEGDPLAGKPRTQSGSGDSSFVIHHSSFPKNPPLFPGVNIEGLREGGIFPPDPAGDIGRDHYVQAVNSLRQGQYGSTLKVWDKDGNPVFGPFRSDTKFWSQVGENSIGDPIIQYDHAAERWVFVEMNNSGTNRLLIAISDNSDPTGSWKAYRFQTDGFPDYPKLYVWHDAYYLTVNEIVGSGNVCSGYALDRAALLAGEDDFGIYRFQMPTYTGIVYQPGTGVDWEAGPPPPPGSPGLIMRVWDDSWDNADADHLQVWKVFVNWDNPSNSRLEGPQKIYVAPFEATVCWGYFLECVEQPDPQAPRISAQDQIIMYRIPYRNFGTHESLVLNHIADVSGQVGQGGDAAIRWYELRRTPSNPDWQLYQQGTYAPDAVNRFMGTLSMDASGNIALGYTVCDATSTYPGIRITGHRASDPLGQMSQEEYSLIEGSQSSSTFRWGDYSTMTVDPIDGKTFWFTGEYMPPDAGWGTRIGSFVLRRDTFDTRPKALAAPQPLPGLTNAEPVTVEVFNEGLEPATGVRVTLKFEGATIATETIAATIPPGASVLHTFQPKVDVSVPGRTYTFDLITKYAPDQYLLNDSIHITLRKPTSHDAAIGGKVNTGGTVCASEHTFDFVLKNAAAVPLTSVDIKFQVNSNPFQTYNWTGNLAPDARDTVRLAASAIKNGVNFLNIFTANPNGRADEDRSNDSTNVKFVGNLGGTPTRIVATAVFGKLTWEIRDKSNNQIVASGTATTAFNPEGNYCLADGKCYRLILKGQPFEWQGNFELHDMFDSLLVQRGFVSGQEIIEFCTAERKSADVGALKLLNPRTSGGLTASEPVTVSVRNYGKTAQTDIQVRYRLDGGAWQTETVPGTLQPGETETHTFAATVDLGTPGDFYRFDVETILPGDEAAQNDAIHPVVYHRPPYDMGLLNVSVDRACADLDDIIVYMRLRNNGTETVDTTVIAATLNGQPLPLKIVDASLEPTGVLDFNYYIEAQGFGPQDFRAEIVNVQSLGKDFTPENDTLGTAFSLSQNGFPVYLTLDLDGKPHETRWELVDDAGNIVAAEGPYRTGDDFITRTFCLPLDACFKFRLFDSGNDGMQGYASLFKPDGTAVWEIFGEDFGAQTEVDFCASTPCSGFLASADVQNASAAGASDGSITIHATGGTPPYLYSLDNSFFATDSVFTGLVPGKYTIYILDSGLLCETSVTVEVKFTVAAGEAVVPRQLSVSPNPTAGVVSVRLPARAGESEAFCEVFDARGQYLFAVRMARWDDELRGLLSLEKYPAGAYFVRVKGLERSYVGVVQKG